jgi:hypothetical protein
MKKKNNKFSMDFGGFLQSVSPLLGLIPGGGAIAAPIANMAGQMISQQNQPQAYMPKQQNTNPYGMAMGGLIDPPKKKVYKDKKAYDLAYKSYTDSLKLFNLNKPMLDN